MFLSPFVNIKLGRGDFLLYKKTFVLVLFLAMILFSMNHLVEATVSNPNHIKIVIDPGHGGHDSGAIGINGIYEKDVNLDISLRLKELLLAEGYQVILTREDDRTLLPYKTTAEKRADLQARVDLATNVNADLFVSIHANYYKSNSKGALILYYDPSNNNPSYQATDRMKQWAEESRQLGATVLQSITSTLGLEYLGVEPSNVYVVRSGTVPSILVETAFLSNWEEATKLADPTFRQAMAESIANGILGYLPPRFIDVRNHWAKTEIATLSYQGIINGYQDRLFKPDQSMTRVEWIALLNKTLPVDNVEHLAAPTQFSDIDENYWAYSAIMNAVQQGIVNGYTDGTFRPNQVINREEMAVMLYRSLNMKDGEVNHIIQEEEPNIEEPSIDDSNSEANSEAISEEDLGVIETISISSAENIQSPTTSAFDDIPSVHWSNQAITALSDRGLIKGIKENKFGFGKSVTRAEAATLIYRMIYTTVNTTD